MVKNNAVPKYDNDESKKDNDSLGCVPSLDEQWAGLGKNKNAARQAAGTEVEMEQILNCLKEEMKKSGKNLQREDFGPYYSLMNGG